MLPAHGPYDGLSRKPGWTTPTTGKQSAFVQLLHSTRPHSESGAYVYQIRLLFVPTLGDQTQPFSGTLVATTLHECRLWKHPYVTLS
jgi:hypothetical protein